MSIKRAFLVIAVFSVFNSTASAQNLPFLYLNQYFEYSVINSNQIELAQKVFDFEKLEIVVSKQDLFLNFENLKDWIAQDTVVILKDGKKGAIQKVLVKENQRVLKINLPAGAVAACLSFSSRFSNAEFCKTFEVKANEISTKPIVKINARAADLDGTVVLKEKDEVISFLAVLSASNSVLLKTKKRNVLPAAIQKNANDDTLNIKFKDQTQSVNNTWDEKVSLDQAFFLLQLDPVLSLKQDIYFNRPNLKTSAMNYSTTVVKNKVNHPYQKYGLVTEAFAIFTGIKGKSNALDVSLNSDLGKGLRATYRWPLASNWDGFAQAHIFQTTIVADIGNQIFKPTQLLYAAAGGLNYIFNSKFSFLTELRLQNDLFFKSSSVSAAAVEVTTGLNKILSVTPSWDFYQGLSDRASLDIGGQYLMATEASGQKVNAGFKYTVGLNYSRHLDFGQLSLAMLYANRAQDTESFVFREQVFLYGFGYRLVF